LTWCIINGTTKINLSSYLPRRFGAGLQYVKQAVFRKEGATIAHYFIAQKIERAKHYYYNEMTLSEIAIQLIIVASRI
jgi:hypothetical protein